MAECQRLGMSCGMAGVDARDSSEACDSWDDMVSNFCFSWLSWLSWPALSMARSGAGPPLATSEDFRDSDSCGGLTKLCGFAAEGRRRNRPWMESSICRMTEERLPSWSSAASPSLSSSTRGRGVWQPAEDSRELADRDHRSSFDPFRDEL
eukprot:CAMPEP_0181469456 /NCGR_PEP_ID=MMETSP1110-20121109/38026_1 /TAXON_ID=174948 /ORGANISM="Symbiodinium sp., Strain CCMP421" /LENGTH=150 /DNA_ID=CAMNT_0023594359 /DNA_START=145 /DNA_END=597 /DNA_ORIENTATION=+